MSVTEIGQLHNRYLRLSEKFKALWTYNQFAAGVYKNFLDRPIPYNINFQGIYDSIKKASDVIQTGVPSNASPMMDKSEKDLQVVIQQLVEADQAITASILRRFFEKLRRQDEKIVFYLIKFQIYADLVTGEGLDKLDFLFTKIAENYIEERGEYSSKDTLELRKTFHSLTSIRPMDFGTSEDIAELIRTIRGIREEIQKVEAIEQLTDQNLLVRARELKHAIKDKFFHPDVLVEIVNANVTSKNRFMRLYRDEEDRLVEDARRLLENEDAIAQGFGQTNPELIEEMNRFKKFKQEFDDSRAQSNVKHNVVTQLKASMNSILNQLDRGLDSETGFEEMNDPFFLQAGHGDLIESKFGQDPLLHPYLERMVTVLDSQDRDNDLTGAGGPVAPEVKALRLEPWEVTSFQKLFWNRARGPGETDELLTLYLRGACLRVKIDEEASILSAVRSSEEADSELLVKVNESLDRAKELDQTFKEFLQEGIYSNPKNLHRLYRSRLRLLRGFSGLWLVFDQFAQEAD